MAERGFTAGVPGILRPSRYERRPLFLHFFDLHFLEERSAHRIPEMRAEAERALRLAVILGDPIFVPAASYYESRLGHGLLNQLRGTDAEDGIFLVGSGGNVFEFAEEKKPQYG